MLKPLSEAAEDGWTMTYFTSDAPPLLYLLLVFFRLWSLAISTGSGLSGSCSPSKLLDARVACESGNWDRRNLYFRCAQSSKRSTTQYCGNLLSLPQTDKNRLNHGHNLKVINLKACLHEGGGPQVGEVTCGGSPHLTCKRDHIKMTDYMDRRVTPTKRVTSPTWGPPLSCKQAFRDQASHDSGSVPSKKLKICRLC